MRNFEQKVLKQIKGHGMINPSAKVLVALSGGADSVCLFLVLKALQKTLHCELAAVHVNHMLRDTADRDEEFVRRLCQKAEISLYVKKVDVRDYASKHGLGEEEAARILRYEVFEQIKRDIQADVIALAHHMDDQAETVLFHISRGCRIEGLRGMKPIRDGYIRPLLGVMRKDIEAYLRELSQDYVTDETNLDTHYNRNFIRNEILPVMTEKICEKTTQHIADMAEHMLSLEDYLNSQMSMADQDCVIREENKIKLMVPKLQALHEYMQTQIVKSCLCELSQTNKDIATVHVTEVLSLNKKQTGRSVDLPYGMRAIKEYDFIILQKEAILDNGCKQNPSFPENRLLCQKVEIPFEKKVLLADGRYLCVRGFDRPLDVNIPTKTYTKWLDYDKINGSVVLRTVQKNDYFIFDEAHKKQVLKYLKNEKVPAEKRKQLQVLAVEDHVLYIIGGRISGAFKITDETKRILEIIVTEE